MTTSSRPIRVLVVEDELLIALDLEQTLVLAGYEVVGPAPRVGEALELIEAEPIDAALLDVQVESETVFPVADALATKGVPFLFLSGHGADMLPPAHVARPCLMKPYSSKRMLESLGRLVSPLAPS